MNVVPQLETCRMCANCYVSNNRTDFIQLFQRQENIQCVLDFIHKEINSWQLKITPNDGLPDQICLNCYEKFSAIDIFRQECVDAQNLLQRAKQITDESQLINVSEPQTIAQEEPIAVSEPLVEENVELELQQNIEKNNEQCLDIFNNSTIDNSASDEVSYNQTASTDDATWDEVIAQEADTTTQSSTEENVKKNNDSADLEQMLEGSIIPKKSVENTSLTDKDDEDMPEETISKRIASFKYACNYCYCPTKGPIAHLVFKTSDALSQHFFDAHDPKLPYPCPNCPELFATARKRNYHVNILQCGGTRNNHTECPYCKKSIRTTQEAHEKTCDFISNWQCQTCGKNLNKVTLRTFRNHQRSHDVDWQYRCNICNRIFLHRHNLIAHKRQHEKLTEHINTNNFKCIKCNQVCSTEYDLKRHELKAHNGKTLFHCEYCSKGFATFPFLRRHIQNAHSSQTYNCPHCHETFQSKLKLHFHLQRTKREKNQCIPIQRQNKKSNQKSFACNQCSKRFNLKEQLEAHIEAHDARLRPYRCRKCNVRCRTAFDLKQHTNFAHLDARILECDFPECGKKFAYKKDLEMHTLYHSELKFQCTFEDCTTNCANELALKEHMQIHESISCEYCGKLYPPNEIQAHLNSTHNNSNNNNTNTSNVNNTNQNKNNENDILDISNNQQINCPKTITNFDFSDISFENFEDNAHHKDTLLSNKICSSTFSPLLGNDITLEEEEELLRLASDTIANNLDFDINDVDLNVNDSFISSLLDTDFEIGVN